jgi:hypothetical protein
MIGYATNPTEAGLMKIYENTASSWITDFTEVVSQKYSDYFDLTVVPSGSSYGSDHASFWDFGYHAVFDHEYKFNPHWHQSTDTIENMDMDYDTRCSRLMIATLGELAEAQSMSEPPETPDAPSGPSEWTIDIEATFTSSTTDPEGDSIYYMFDWGDGTFSEWVGPFASGDTGSADHNWTELGEYEVKVIAKDTFNSKSEWSEPAILNIIVNKPPNTPTINGPTSIKPKTQVTFTVQADDPENHEVYYMLTWGDGTSTNWLGPYESGEEIEVKNHWNGPGTYKIKAQAKDFIGDKSDWGELEVSVPRTKTSFNNPLFSFLSRVTNLFPIIKILIQRMG